MTYTSCNNDLVSHDLVSKVFYIGLVTLRQIYVVSVQQSRIKRVACHREYT